MRACSITLACTLAACGSPPPPEGPAPPGAGAPGAPGAPGGGACRDHPCPGHRYLVVPAGEARALDGGETIAVDATAPGGDAADVDVDGVAVTLALGGDAAVAWIDGLRVELAAVRDGAAWLIVDRVTDEVVATETVRVGRGDTVRLHGRTDLTFVGHPHKRAAEGGRDPLMVVVDHHDGEGETSYVLDVPGDLAWTWRDLRFTVVEYAHGASMVLAVDRLALAPAR